MSEKPSLLARISSPWIVLSKAELIELRRPAAKMATNDTSASPIMSAAAVEAVRPGLRTEFSRARRPDTPRKRSSGRPTIEAIGRTSRGLSSATPMKMATAPTPTHASPGLSAPNTPRSISAIPTPVRTKATAVRTRWLFSVSSTAPSRRPVTGGTRVTRRAGISDASTVSSVPSTSDRMIVRAAITVPSLGRSISSAWNSALMAGAKPIPSTRPSAEASRPSTNASRITDVTSWRRLAPSVRSMANSRVRWATVIENVLKIRNAATNSDTPAKISSAVRRMLMNSLTSSFCEAVFSSPVSTSTERGSASLSVRFRTAGATPSAATLIWSNSPFLRVMRWASGSVNTAMLEPPKELTLPSLAMPASRRCGPPPCPRS